MQEAVFDSALTINAVNGKSSPVNLQNVDDVDERSTAVKSAKRMPGYTTDIGASLPKMRRGNTTMETFFLWYLASSGHGVKT